MVETWDKNSGKVNEKDPIIDNHLDSLTYVLQFGEEANIVIIYATHRHIL